jgi:hypothetical protein
MHRHRLRRWEDERQDGEEIEVESRHVDPYLALVEHLRAQGCARAEIETRSDGTVRVERTRTTWAAVVDPRALRDTAAPAGDASGTQATQNKAAAALGNRGARPTNVHTAELALRYADDEPCVWQPFAFRSMRSDPWEALRAYLHEQFGSRSEPPSRDGVVRVRETVGRDGSVERLYRLPRVSASSTDY